MTPEEEVTTSTNDELLSDFDTAVQEIVLAGEWGTSSLAYRKMRIVYRNELLRRLEIGHPTPLDK